MKYKTMILYKSAKHKQDKAPETRRRLAGFIIQTRKNKQEWEKRMRGLMNAEKANELILHWGEQPELRVLMENK